MRRVLFAVVVLLVSPVAVEAQRNCSKGKPCGNTCIARDKVCRVGAPPATTAPTPPASSRPSTAATSQPQTLAVLRLGAPSGTYVLAAMLDAGQRGLIIHSSTLTITQSNFSIRSEVQYSPASGRPATEGQREVQQHTGPYEVRADTLFLSWPSSRRHPTWFLIRPSTAQADSLIAWTEGRWVYVRRP